ncbi:MAG TPA: AmpG family muropeptide MFS transporter [Pyrinomonadaceae bacterium]|jgi:PAT family beta-lactamase induction signal transducer AmpG|nr:AmpG family muropeptide MFS transporter [Pyrinomonadaceae bacterium]
MTILLLLGFSSGTPLLLTKDTFKIWMANEKVPVELIGLTSVVGLPYALKFLWSPAMDRYVPPFLGRRRGWLLISQITLIVAIVAMAFGNPDINSRASLIVVGFFALLVAFSSASQDIVADAYRTEALERDEYGIGTGYFVTGYRIGLLVSGTLALILVGVLARAGETRFAFSPEYATHLSWRLVYVLMAATILVGVMTTVYAPEPRVNVRPPQTFGEAVIMPFKEFLGRNAALEILLFISVYKLGTVAATTMAPPFVVELGFSREEIGAIYSGIGIAATILGFLTGGAIIMRVGLRRSLLIFGALQGASLLLFFFLARQGRSRPLLIASIAAVNLCIGMGTAAYTAFLMSLCNKRFTATQYALFTGLMALNLVIIGSLSGFVAKILGAGAKGAPTVSMLGWERYFLVCAACAVPGLLMLLRYKAWRVVGERESREAL